MCKILVMVNGDRLEDAYKLVVAKIKKRNSFNALLVLLKAKLEEIHHWRKMELSEPVQEPLDLAYSV